MCINPSMADAQAEANANVRNLGKLLTATIPQLVALGGGKSTHKARVDHYTGFLTVFTPEKWAAVTDILQAKVGTVEMEKVPYQKDCKLEVQQLTALTTAVSKGGFSAASPNSIPKCLRALLYAKKHGHNIDGAIKQMETEIAQKEKKARASVNGGNGAAATENAMETGEPFVDENADEASSAKKKHKSQLVAAQQALEQQLRDMLKKVQNKEWCDASAFEAIKEGYNRVIFQNTESPPAFNSQTPSGASPSAELGKVPDFAAEAGGFMQSLQTFAPPSPPAKGASTPTKPLALTDGAEETATGKKRKQDDQASKKEAPAAADAAKASNKKSKTADAADKLQIAASGKTLAASATSSPDKKAAAKKDEEAKKKKEEERLAKEKDKEEKERVKKEKAAKEKEEKERLAKEKAAKEKEEKERLAKEKDKEEKERLKKEKEAAAAPEKRAADAAEKHDDKRKSLQAEKEKLEAQLRNKKSPAATPASKGSNAGEPGSVPAFAGDKWHADVKAQLTSLEKKGKLKEEALDQGALKQLKTLPYEVALVCLIKVMNEKNAIRDINAFIVKNCTHLRNQWGIDDAASSSSDDDSSDDKSESEEEEEASKAKASTPAAAEATPKVVDVKPVDDSDSEDDEEWKALKDAMRASGGESADEGDSDSD